MAEGCIGGRVAVDEGVLGKLVYGEGGLIPAAVQDYTSGKLLTLAYMNRESLEISLLEGRTCFYSRSRRELWRKGETSGNTQRIIKITADCDYDALLVEVAADGPACHTGAQSCFHNALSAPAEDMPGAPAEPGANVCGAAAGGFSIAALYEIIKSRKEEKPDGSYTAYLFKSGIEKILKKVGEECSEVIIAAMKRNEGEIIYEAADLCYHMLVLLCEAGIDPSEITRELSGRHGAGG